MTEINIEEKTSTYYYNKITPIIKGLNINAQADSTFLNPLLTSKFGPIGTYWRTSGHTAAFNLPAGGLELLPPNISSLNDSSSVIEAGMRVKMSVGFRWISINSSLSGTTTVNASSSSGSSSISSTDIAFCSVNDYCFIYAVFSDSNLTTLKRFTYVGSLREPAANFPEVYPLGFCSIDFNSGGLFSNRPLSIGLSTASSISNAANEITNPPIFCTEPTEGADVTDIIIRVASSPNLALGKLYNCISLPAEAEVGQIWKNTGVDPETNQPHASSNTNKYLVIMPWGSRKLGMRVWTEGFA